jgi:hypothetical protein
LRFERDGDVLIAVRPGRIRDVWQALARLDGLPLPIKLSEGRDGAAELRAELLCGPGVDAESAARLALEAGAAWLAGEVVSALPVGGEPDSDSISAGLAELPAAWAWEDEGGGAFRVHATSFGVSARVNGEVRDGAIVASIRSAVPAEDLPVRAALLRLALEANRRLRLARVGVSFAGGTAALVWDAIASPGLAVDRSLPISVQAVVGAHALTRRLFRALSDPVVALGYLDATGGDAARLLPAGEAGLTETQKRKGVRP